MTDSKQETTDASVPIARRTLLKTTGVAAALSLGAGTAVGGSHGQSSGQGQGQGPSNSNPNAIDPIFGLSSAGPNPCAGDVSTDCFEDFRPPIRPDREVEVHIDLPQLLVLAGSQGVLSDVTTESMNEEAADGTIDEVHNLHNPEATVRVGLPGGGSEGVTVEELARMLAGMVGFHFEPAGLRVHPGDIVLFSAETPDHGVAAYHERHGRQNRVPDSVGPVASPLIPAGGYWLYRFETEGVYDFYCPPHQVFGMVMRVVVTDDDEDVPGLSVEQTGRPPEAENLLPVVLGGLDPNIPSSLEALESEALEPENIAESGPVSWHDVVSEHRG